MKIRTQLFLYLLPAFTGSIFLIASLLPYANFLLIASCASLTLLFMIALLYTIANRISRPVHQLKHAALEIAAGQYGDSIRVDGPAEISELSNTLNVLSECLNEQINRVKETSLQREKMYGEYECAILLQHLMLQKNIDNCNSEWVAAKAISVFSPTPKGLYLDFPKLDDPNLFQIQLIEAKEEGLEGIYALLTRSRKAPSRTTIYDGQTRTLQFRGGHAPFVWSSKEQKLLEPKSKMEIDRGDFFFLFNEGMIRFYQNRKALSEFIAKVLRIFASEGIETTALMLQKELTFASKRRKQEEDLHLLCFQVLNTL